MIPETAGVVELRQYTLQPGKREVLVDLFDREFVETQEAVGIRLYGQFRDMDDPNRFVFVRGFRDMVSRAEALRAFYDCRSGRRIGMPPTRRWLIRAMFSFSGRLQHPRVSPFKGSVLKRVRPGVARVWS